MLSEESLCSPVQSQLLLPLLASIPGIQEEDGSEPHAVVRDGRGEGLVVVVPQGAHADPVERGGGLGGTHGGETLLL